MDDYRKFVRKVSNSLGPSEVILNRSIEHATVVMETLFEKAVSKVEILTNKLTDEVYGSPTVIAAAKEFLRRENSRIEILCEESVDRATHPLLRELDQAGHAAQISLRFVPENLRRTYLFNFATADGGAYRYEENRNSSEAIVQFGPTDFGKTLKGTFAKLEAGCSDMFVS
jgi:hypothetical protein